MTGEHDDGLDSPGRRDPLLWSLVYLGLALSGGSGIAVISKTDDRIRGAEVRSELLVRDTRLGAIEHRLEEIEEDIDRIDRHGPSIGNAYLRETVDRHDRRLDKLEQEE